VSDGVHILFHFNTVIIKLVKDKIQTWGFKSSGMQCCVMGQVSPAFKSNAVPLTPTVNQSKAAHSSVTQWHSITSQTTYTSVTTSHLARAKLLLRSNKKEWAWPCEHLQQVKNSKRVTKIASFGFRFVNLHSEGSNLHFKKVRKLGMCNEYKNLTHITDG
jgi:hypothetical protein